MSAEKMGWASLFGISSKKTNLDESKPFDPEQIVQDTPIQTDVMRDALGKNIFQSIKMYQKLLKSKSFSGQMRRDGENAYNFMVTVAKRDVTNLIYLQKEAVKISSTLRNDEAKHIMVTKIIGNLDKLILKQAALVRKIHCPIKIQTSAQIKKEVTLSMYETVIKVMSEGDYKPALVFFLGFNDFIEPQRAEQLYLVAQGAAKTHPTDSDDFLAVLKLRLFLQDDKKPQLIDYSVLENNKLLNDQSIKAISSLDLIILPDFLDEAVKFSGCFWEAKLKENYASMILTELDALVNWVLQGEGHDNHLPFLRR